MSSNEKIIELNKCPMHMLDGWVPPVPAFIGKLEIKPRAVVLYVGIQRSTSQSLAALNALLKLKDV